MEDNFEEISIDDVISILIKRKRLIAVVTLAFIVFGLLQAFVLTKPRYVSSVTIEINDIDTSIMPADDAENSKRVHNLLQSINGSTNIKFEDYLDEITSDEVLKETIKNLDLKDTYTAPSLRSAISVNPDAEAKTIELGITVKNTDLGSEILMELSENFKEHITKVSQENSLETLEVIEEQMKTEKDKYSEALEEYKEDTEGIKSAFEIELEIEAIYGQLTEYKLSLNDLKIKKDGINGALQKGVSSEAGGMLIRPNLEGGDVYLGTSKGALEVDLAETDARISSTTEGVSDLQKKIETLKIDYQEAEFEESTVRQNVELTKENYEVFDMKRQELTMKSSMDIGGMSVNLLSETISENKQVGTRKAIKLGILTILGLMSGVILSFILEYIEYRKKKELKR